MTYALEVTGLDKSFGAAAVLRASNGTKVTARDIAGLAQAW
ncbi:hypothetical protein SIM91_01710 [Rhodococcus opacus]|nr:hypothetical protein [Rhodococcus opacus]MDX5962063.1 hypothetical protein [Rhodococcus opacus]